MNYPIPCPFCGFADVECKATGRDEWSVCCPECYAIGPAWQNENGAINIWNEREQVAWDAHGPIRNSKP